MSDKVQLIKEEIERRIEEGSSKNDISEGALALDSLLSFIDSLPEEPASEDLEEAAEKYAYKEYPSIGIPNTVIELAYKAGAEWQKQKDEKLFKEDSWNYIEEQYPDITKEEKLMLYDISIKSRLAGANTIKQKMMKTLVGGEIVKDIHNQLSVKSEPLNDTFRDIKFGDKVKIIIIKSEQQ